MKIAVCFGTRPEVIKLAPLCKKLSGEHDVINVFTGQHHSLYDGVKHLIPNVDYSMPFPEHTSICDLYSILTRELGALFQSIKPDLVIVQGDTASAYSAALCAFLQGIKIGHVEAGLRTGNIASPFPEEFNRQVISKIATYNWCPSTKSMENLMAEKVHGKVILTGNTIVDFINNKCDRKNIYYGSEIIITLHRRENKDVFCNILGEINQVANAYPNLKFIFPVHPNAIIKKQVSMLTANNIYIEEPMAYETFLEKLMSCRGIITDSGGIQEEAVCLHKKVLICRENTERLEGVEAGLCKLVGSKILDNFSWIFEPINHEFINPYGDGNSCEKIMESLR